MSRKLFNRREKIGLITALSLTVVFGVNLEQRTALRRVPMTDLGVFTTAAWAVWSGDNLYGVKDWHGWHYHYPPTWAILMAPLANPPAKAAPEPPKADDRTGLTVPWGQAVRGSRYYGLHQQNLRFFIIVAVWYAMSVMLCLFAAHALACVLERKKLGDAPPTEENERRRWWLLRVAPLLVCIGSIGTDLSRGQADIAMLAAVAGGVYLSSRNRKVAAGFWLALPATVKLFPPFLLLYPIWKRRWRMAAGVLAGLVVLLILLPVAVLGVPRTIESYRVWREVLVKPSFGEGSDKSRAAELTGMTSTDNQSLLAAIHNWRYRGLARRDRPAEAAAADRKTVYLIGAVMLLGIGLALWAARQEAPRDSLLISGLLIGLALVLSPVVHNYYYLLMLPMVAALIDRSVTNSPELEYHWKVLMPVLLFMLTDVIVRFPAVGSKLRDMGLPLLSLLYLLGAGAAVLLTPNKSSVEIKCPIQARA